jgi:hypothetical protein
MPAKTWLPRLGGEGRTAGMAELAAAARMAVFRTDTRVLEREYDGQGGIRVTVCYTSYRPVSKYAACVLC